MRLVFDRCVDDGAPLSRSAPVPVPDTPDNVRTARRVFLETMAEGRFDPGSTRSTAQFRSARCLG